MDNKIAVISMVKNEADIIESFVRHVFSYADVLFVADHNSTDETCKILKLLQKEGFAIRIEIIEQRGYFQAEIMTRLLYRAIDEDSADIIVAADADEFLVMNDEQVNTDQLRMVLQSMDNQKVHYIPLRGYALLNTENDQDVFLLSRPCCCEEKYNDLYKVIVGGGAAKKYHFSISQGNHKVLFPSGELAPEDLDMIQENIHIAHFAWRGKEQQLSKALCGWLTNIEGFSEYTYYASHWRQIFNDFLATGKSSSMQLNNPVAASLSHYAGRYMDNAARAHKGTMLRYTRNRTSYLVNILRLAESLASSSCQLRTLSNRRLVSVLLVYDGDFEALQTSFRSIVAQSYPYFEVLMLDFCGDGHDSFEQLKSQFEPQFTVKLISSPIFQQISEEAQGEYVQWVLPGDKLIFTKLINMLSVMENHRELSIAFSLGNSRNAENPFCPPILSLPREKRGQLIPPKVLGRSMLLQGALISCGLSGPLFRREIMQGAKWFSKYFIGARIMELSVWVEMITSLPLLLLSEAMVVVAHQWTADEYILHEMEWHYLTEYFRGQKLLEEEEYQVALENFAKEYHWMEKKIRSCASPDLYEEYRKANTTWKTPFASAGRGSII